MQLTSPRSSTACIRCYKRKVKCSREKQCRNCRLANKDCQYPTRDRNVSVSENYLRALQAAAAQSTTVSIAQSPLGSVSGEGNIGATAEILPPGSTQNQSQLSDPLVEDPTSEVFVSGLKQLHSPAVFLGGPDFSNAAGISPSIGIEAPNIQRQAYEFYQLDFDDLNPSCSFKLPPYPYALLLFDRFNVFVGHDWHWFKRNKFKKSLDSTYKDPKAKELKDRMWLCRLLTVFALGESYNSEATPEIRLTGDKEGSLDNSNNTQEAVRSPPGTEFFEQALALLKIHHEDPSIEQVEALNLVAFYSYSLNRKKAAYMYAGLSIRMSNMLKLHRPSSPPLPAVELEHRKRVWWTTYCVDRMTSTELGLPPAFQVHQVEQSYPDDSTLLPADRVEFHDAETLTTQVQLAFIHGDICENVRSIRKDNTTNVGDLTRPILHRLEDVRARLPSHMSFDVENGMPPAMKQMADRSLASLYQRYHQCFVLLLRPLFLKQISYLLAGDTAKAYQEDVKFLTNTCLRAARTNLKIIIDLRSCDRMTRFGFWESLHLSSGLMILSLAMSVNSRWPNTFDENSDDRNTYDTAKGLLREMIQAGNLGSKGHGQMLAEVEQFQNGLFGGNAQHVFDLGWDVDEWIEQLLGS
ncbi:fungal-specific transcription factor domain-containing protein [Aspergillus karnatakaensis]|uniref:transcription factor domain-containing protein n=1 Tax=Aspergillus karnatakaensis TaxID=1810916 RepID=UPI003CCD6EEA